MKKSYNLIGILLVAVWGFSCENFLTEEPQSQIDANTFYTSGQSAEMGLTGCYNRFFNQQCYPRAVMLIQVSTDDVNQPTGSFSTFQNRNLMTAPDGDELLWSTMYQTIVNVNFLLKEVENLSESLFEDPDRKEEILGEAHFLKGAAYYYLYTAWGEVPLVKEYTEDPNEAILPKSSKDEVRAYVIEQMELAVSMLPEVISSYPDDSETNLRKGRGSKWAAKTYLARLALEAEDWQSALELATEVVNSGLYPMANPWRLIFQEPYNASESIFEMQNDYSPGFFGTGIYGWFMGFDFEWSAGAVSSFETPDTVGVTQGKDVRFDLAYTPHSWAKGRWQPNKILPRRMFSDGGIEQANIPIIRLSELKLIRAEALTELNYSANKTEVVAILNELRARAEDATWVNEWYPSAPTGTSGIDQLEVADYTSQSELMAAVRAEKRRELVFEDVIRWTDLMRWDKEYLKTVTSAPSDDYLYWPVPPDEIVRNELLIQNPAYE